MVAKKIIKEISSLPFVVEVKRKRKYPVIDITAKPNENSELKYERTFWVEDGKFYEVEREFETKPVYYKGRKYAKYIEHFKKGNFVAEKITKNLFKI